MWNDVFFSVNSRFMFDCLIKLVWCCENDCLSGCYEFGMICDMDIMQIIVGVAFFIFVYDFISVCLFFVNPHFFFFICL